MISINMMLKLTQGHGHKVNSQKMTKLESVKSEHTDRQTDRQTNKRKPLIIIDLDMIHTAWSILCCNEFVTSNKSAFLVTSIKNCGLYKHILELKIACNVIDIYIYGVFFPEVPI